MGGHHAGVSARRRGRRGARRALAAAVSSGERGTSVRRLAGRSEPLRHLGGIARPAGTRPMPAASARWGPLARLLRYRCHSRSIWNISLYHFKDIRRSVMFSTSDSYLKKIAFVVSEGFSFIFTNIHQYQFNCPNVTKRQTVIFDLLF